MKIKQHARVALQSALATFFVALAVVGITQAATTIGNNITTGTVTITSTTEPQLNVKYDSSNLATLDVGSAGTTTLVAHGGLNAGFIVSDVLRVATSSANAFAVRGEADDHQIFVVNSSNGYVGIGTNLVPAFALQIATTTTSQLVTGYDTSNYLALQTGSTGTTTLDAVGAGTTGFLVVDSLRIATSSAFALQVRDGNQRGILEVNARAGYVGIGTSTPPSYALHVSTSTTPQFVLANDRLNYLSLSVGVDGTTTLDAVGGNGLYTGIISSDPFRISTSSASAFQVVDLGGTGSTTFVVNSINNRVGIGSSTPTAMLSVGNEEANGNRLGSSFGTTTIDIGRACFRSIDMNGTTFYWMFDLNDSSLIATRTTSCF